MSAQTTLLFIEQSAKKLTEQDNNTLNSIGSLNAVRKQSDSYKKVPSVCSCWLTRQKIIKKAVLIVFIVIENEGLGGLDGLL